MKSIAVIFAAMLALAGCVQSPTRATAPEQFKLIASENVTLEYREKFIECLMDGYQKAQNRGSHITVRQERRNALTRIETVAGQFVYLSTDVFDNGRADFYDLPRAMLSNEKELNVFKICGKAARI